MISAEEGAKSLGSTTVENEAPEEDGRTPAERQSNARRSVSIGGRLSAKPRRMSRSPAKQTPRGVGSTGLDTGAEVEFQSTANPFKRGGLRRSPVGSEEVEVPETDSNPFQRRGLRRSPRAVNKLSATEEAFIKETTPRNPSTIFESPLVPEDMASNLPPLAESGRPPQQTKKSTASQAMEFGNPQSSEQLIESTNDSPLSPIPTARSQIQSHQEEELELPPIPKQSGADDPVSGAVLTGIHDVPSSRARKNRDLARKIRSSSPLKPNLQRVPEPSKEANPTEDPQPEKPKRRKSARFSTIEDPHAAKKKARDDLLRELQQLQSDVALANQENKRLQLHYESKRSPPNVPSNSEELLSLLIRSTAPEPLPKANATQNSAFKSIGSFLPFSSRRKRVSRTLLAFDKPIPSHLPISVDNPLPYLQAFSPLTYTSKITLLPSKPQASESSSSISSQSISQLHLITASHFSGLFTARLSMIVDTTLLSISSVDIERLPPSAEKELGTFLRERFTQEGALTKDIGLICWAMGRWVEVSVLRARFWCAVENELGTPEARAKSIRQKKKRKRRHVIAEDDDEEPLDGHEEEEFKKQRWTRRELLPHMGRTAIELATDKVELRIEWRIKFDWTGEVDSAVTASVRLPRSCKSFPLFYPDGSWMLTSVEGQESDDRKSLLKVPESFAKLVKQKGPLGAARTVIGLLMPEPS